MKTKTILGLVLFSLTVPFTSFAGQVDCLSDTAFQAKLEKRERFITSMLKNGREYAAEMKEIASGAKKTMLMSSSIASGAAMGPLVASGFAQLGGTIDIGLSLASGGFISAPAAAVIPTVEAVAGLGGLAFFASDLYLTGNTKMPKTAEAKAPKLAQDTLISVAEKFEAAHAQMKKKRDSVDTSYSKLRNNLSFGRKDSQSMSEIYETILADNLLWESELKVLAKMRDLAFQGCSPAKQTNTKRKAAPDNIASTSFVSEAGAAAAAR